MQDTTVIIGGGAGGITTATQLKKQAPDARVIVIEKGAYIGWAGCPTPYYIAGKLPRMSVVHYPHTYFIEDRKIEAYIHHEVVSIDFENKTVTVKGDKLNGDISYDNLVVSIGGRASIPTIEGLEEGNHPKGVFLLRSAENAFAIDEYITETAPKNGIILGGGFVGMEMAEAFVERAINTTVIKKSKELLPWLTNSLARKRILKIIKEHNVKLLTETSVIRIISDNGQVTSIELDNGDIIDADIILISKGITPNTDLLEKSGLTLDDGKIQVNEYLETKIPNVYALGDLIWSKNIITEKPIYAPFGDVADKQAILLGNTLAGTPLSFRGVIGSSSTTIFDWQVARTGLTLKQALDNGFNADKVSVKSLARVPGFEGTRSGIVEVIYDKDKEILLGASIVSHEAAAQFIDTFAIAITHKLTLTQLFEVDYAYSPTTSIVWNPLLAVYRKILNR